MQTSCPECHTTFRVSQEQLGVRRGLVRCGRCNAVFNAYDALMPELEEPPLVAPEPVPDALSVEGFASGPVQDEMPAWEPAQARGLSESLAETLAEPFSAPPARAPVDAAATALLESDRQSVTEPIPEPTAPPAVETADSILLSELPTRRPAGLPLPLGQRLALGFAGVALLVLLVVQITVFLRAELAAALPASRPLLAALCQPFGCTVPLPRQLGREAIASSNLEHDGEQKSRVRLTLLLANRTDQAQAWPVISLTLTDLRETAVARKLFPPRVYLAGDDELADGLGSGREREIRMDLDIGNLAATGYALDLVHP